MKSSLFLGDDTLTHKSCNNSSFARSFIATDDVDYHTPDLLVRTAAVIAIETCQVPQVEEEHPEEGILGRGEERRSQVEEDDQKYQVDHKQRGLTTMAEVLHRMAANRILDFHTNEIQKKSSMEQLTHRIRRVLGQNKSWHSKTAAREHYYLNHC